MANNLVEVRNHVEGIRVLDAAVRGHKKVIPLMKIGSETHSLPTDLLVPRKEKYSIH